MECSDRDNGGGSGEVCRRLVKEVTNPYAVERERGGKREDNSKNYR